MQAFDRFLRIPSPGRRVWGIALLLLLFFASGLATFFPSVEAQEAVEQAAVVAPAAAPAGASLRDRIAELYIVEAAPRGVTLRLREPRDAVETISLRGDEIRINGNRVPRAVATSWLAQDAELVLELAERSPAERRALFGLPADDLPAEVPPPSRRVVVEAPAAGVAGSAERPQAEAESDPAGAGTEVDEEGSDSARVIIVEGDHDGRAPKPPRPPRAPYRSGSQFNVFGDLAIPKGESARDAVAIFGSIRVDGEVRGDVTAVGGSVRVNGQVDGEVTAVNGSVILGPEAEVLRGVTAVGGRVERAEGARVRGSVSEVPISGMPHLDRDWDDNWQWRSGRRGPLHGFWTLVWSLIGLLALALFLAAAMLFAPRAVEGIAERVRLEWWKAGLVGIIAPFAFALALVLVMLVLFITIIGIPFAILLAILVGLLSPFLAIAVVLFCLAGYAAVCLVVGRWVVTRMGWSWTSPYAHLLVGLTLLQALELVGELTSSVGGPARMVGWPMESIGGLIVLVAGFIGFGGALLQLFDRYQARRGASAVTFPAPPPPAPNPPGSTPPAPVSPPVPPVAPAVPADVPAAPPPASPLDSANGLVEPVEPTPDWDREDLAEDEEADSGDSGTRPGLDPE